ncbi:MAG: DUF2723 domain-containing protein [Chloroflexi bacterium]|nr:DUF2723 domain-containing protein [Chloroflexota bacterium]MBE3114713.1 DUF2723 domain-containing protein [Actinomycetota bacterium]
MQRIKEIILKRKTAIFSFFSLTIPLVIYILTLEPKLVGGDTGWYANQIPEMTLMVPTGYPTFSMFLKLFTYLPIGDLAYRLNLFSAIFGALTILFLFLAINKLVKNEFTSFISSMIFAFIVPFWSVANRLEFDTLNTFFIILLIFSAIVYSENKTRKYLYFFFFCLGLSLTNHPLTFFIVPAIALYVIIINPRIFKSVKAIFISAIFFILPLLSYFYLLIRSLQGFGEVNTLLRLFYYVTGRGVTGEIHGGSFGDKDISLIFKVIKDYLNIIYDTYGIVLIIIAIIGFIFLIRKNKKFGICTFLLIIFNFIVPPLYIGHANPNYLLGPMIVISFYIAFGLLWILNGSIFLFNKSLRNRKILKIDRFLKYFLIAVILLFLVFLPLSFILEHYNELDLSEPLPIYKFWDEAFNNMESGSRVYVFARAANVGMFVDTYEYGEKEIEYIYHTNPRYSIVDMIEALENDIAVYFVGNSGALGSVFSTEQIGRTNYWARYNETLRLFKVIKPLVNIEAVNIKISYLSDRYVREFGEKFTVEYTVKNKNKGSVQINSLELELPDNIELMEVDPAGYINQYPGISGGVYMWVSDSYIIEGEDEINLIVELRGIKPGESFIKFRVTTGGFYINCDDIEMEIKD